ncbi:unnamed protein product [Phaeothamnion confervicola]
MSDIVTGYVVPAFGVLVANALFLAPLKSVVEVSRTKRLGTINPWPWAMILGNCFSWMVFSAVVLDYFVFWANFPGFLLGTFYTATALAAVDLTEVQLNLLRTTLVLCLGLDHLGLMLAFITFDGDDTAQSNVAGWICIIQLVTFYAAPLSTLRTVLKTRDSSYFDLRLAVVCCINGATWVAYGFYEDDAFLWGPNAVGVLNGAIQITCCCLFPQVGDSKLPLCGTGGVGGSSGGDIRKPVDIEVALLTPRADRDGGGTDGGGTVGGGGGTGTAAALPDVLLGPVGGSADDFVGRGLGPRRRSATVRRPSEADTADSVFHQSLHQTPLPSP